MVPPLDGQPGVGLASISALCGKARNIHGWHRLTDLGSIGKSRCPDLVRRAGGRLIAAFAITAVALRSVA